MRPSGAGLENVHFLEYTFVLDIHCQHLGKMWQLEGVCALGCPKKTLFVSIILAVESLVRMGDLSHQKKFQNYRPINDP